jgi:LemA protein
MASPIQPAAAGSAVSCAQTAPTHVAKVKNDWRRRAARRILRSVEGSRRQLLMGTWITLGILVALIAWAVAIYNNLVSLRNRVSNAFSQIDVQLTRRYDLIPNLVEAVKGYMGHERGTLEAVINARNAASADLKKAAANPADPDAIKALAAAEVTLGGTLGRLFALAEAYPDLKANQNMQQLQEELTSTENKVAFARQAFNDAVLSYNNACQNFPGNLVANNFGFKTAEYLEIEQPEKRVVPKVSFS